MPRNRQRRPITAVNIPFDQGVVAFPQNPDARTFWVDPSDGQEGASGEDYRHPVATLQEAIDRCTDDYGDIINVMPGSHSVDTMVSFNKRGITVQAVQFGIHRSAGGENFTVNASSALTTGPAATIYDPCRIIGLGFAGRDLTSHSLEVDCQAAGGFSGGFVSLEYCRFACWYGAIDYGLYFTGGAVNSVYRCSFDGLFAGFDVGAIGMANDGAITPSYDEVVECNFHGVGSGKHAIVHVAGGTPLSFLYESNYLLPGFLGNQGKFLENNSVDATGMLADNWLAPLASQGAAFENTVATIGFADNHYEE